jgi:hypothetical protein
MEKELCCVNASVRDYARGKNRSRGSLSLPFQSNFTERHGHYGKKGLNEIRKLPLLQNRLDVELEIIAVIISDIQVLKNVQCAIDICPANKI